LRPRPWGLARPTPRGGDGLRGVRRVTSGAPAALRGASRLVGDCFRGAGQSWCAAPAVRSGVLRLANGCSRGTWQPYCGASAARLGRPRFVEGRVRGDLPAPGVLRHRRTVGRDPRERRRCSSSAYATRRGGKPILRGPNPRRASGRSLVATPAFAQRTRPGEQRPEVEPPRRAWPDRRERVVPRAGVVRLSPRTDAVRSGLGVANGRRATQRREARRLRARGKL
jgi:hypothetical protein